MKVAEHTAKHISTRRYNAFGQYMKDLYGLPVYKVNVDAGFTCPNRDGSIATGGCIYCNNDSFRPSACTSTLSLREQINKGIPYLRSRYDAEKFIVYFQPYTNTYASVDILERLYREALDNPGVIGLAIGTRPDCIDEDKITLLQSLAKNSFILVPSGGFNTYFHISIRSGRLDRVFDNIYQYLSNLFRVSHDVRKRAVRLDLD